MKKRYYWSMLSLFLLILLFDAFYIPAHKTVSLFLTLGLLHFLLYVPINLLGIYLLYKPVGIALQTKTFTAAAMRRIRYLPWYSALWIFTLGTAYFVLMLVMLFFFPVNTGEITLDEMPGSLWLSAIPSLLYIYSILPAFVTWFLINDFIIDLKSNIYIQFNQAFKPGKKKYGQLLLLTFIILGVLPTILVSLELIVSEVGDKYREFSGITPLAAILPDRVAVLTGIILAVIFITRSFIKPIHALLTGMGKVKKGDYTTRVPVTTEDEIGTLTMEFNNMVDGLKEREIIRDTFGKYVTNDVASVILGNKINAEGEERICTILMTDIENYTTMTEKSTPGEIVKMLNEYFSVLADIIKKHNGVINEFMGDAIFAMFNVPFDDPDHALHATRAGLEIESITKSRTFGNNRKLTTRIGINTGLVVAGNVGATDRLKYSVVGDDVNIAARLEQLNKNFNTHLLVGENTFQLTREHFNFNRLGDIRLKGKERTVKVYQVCESLLPTESPEGN